MPETANLHRRVNKMEFQNQNRVVITGIGLVTPIGIGKDEFWEAAVLGKSGVDEVKSFDTSDFKAHRGCEVKNFCSLC